MFQLRLTGPWNANVVIGGETYPVSFDGSNLTIQCVHSSDRALALIRRMVESYEPDTALAVVVGPLATDVLEGVPKPAPKPYNRNTPFGSGDRPFHAEVAEGPRVTPPPPATTAAPQPQAAAPAPEVATPPAPDLSRTSQSAFDVIEDPPAPVTTPPWEEIAPQAPDPDPEPAVAAGGDVPAGRYEEDPWKRQDREARARVATVEDDLPYETAPAEEPAPEPAADPANGLMERVRAATQLKDVLLAVFDSGVAKTPTTIAEWCRSHKRDVPLLDRIANLDARVARTCAILDIREVPVGE